MTEGQFLKKFKVYLSEKAGFNESHFTLLENTYSLKSVEKGTILLEQAQICSEVYFVSQGLLRAYTLDENGKEHIIQFAPENWWLSDRNSFIYNEPSLFFIDATEDCHLIALSHDFFEVASTIPGFNDFNIKALHNAVRLLQQRVNLLIGASAEDRYLDFIKRYPNLMLRVPQWMIASYLGITPESLSRVRKELTVRDLKHR